MAEVTAFQWAMLVIAFLGAIGTAGTALVAITRAVTRIETNTETRLVAMRLEIDKRFLGQDDVYREVAQGLRKFIELVEAEMHRIELWGRDNYVRKEEHASALAEVRADIRILSQSIKLDFKDLKTEIKADIQAAKN